MSGATASQFRPAHRLPLPPDSHTALPDLAPGCPGPKPGSAPFSVCILGQVFLTAVPCVFPSVKQCRQGTCSPICHSPHHSLLSHTPPSLIYFAHGREFATFPSASRMYTLLSFFSEPLPVLLVPPGCSCSASPLVTWVIPSHPWGHSLPSYSRTLLFAQSPTRQHLSHCPITA